MPWILGEFIEQLDKILGHEYAEAYLIITTWYIKGMKTNGPKLTSSFLLYREKGGAAAPHLAGYR